MIKKLKEKAIIWLSRREYSIKEMTERLSSISDDKSLILDVVHYLVKLNYICDLRFTDTFVKSKYSRFGNSYIIYILKQHNIEKEIVCEVLKKYPSEEERILVLYEKKNKLTHQKIYQYLAQKGFQTQVIQQTLKEYIVL